jgi:hypothetical protein
VSVFSRVSRGQKTYWITLTRPESSLWQATAGVNRLKPEKASNIQINRIDAQISESRATLIKHAFMRILKNAHEDRVAPSHTDSVRRITGGPMEYSIQRPGASALYGTLFGLPQCGSSAHRLANLWDAAIEYCKANPANREPIGILSSKLSE